jgi:hypothetical protein
MNFHHSARSANMTTLTRTLKPLLIAAAVLALMAPAAQAKPLEVPPGPVHSSVSSADKAGQATSGASFGWTELLVGGAFVVIVAGVGILGRRVGNQRPAAAA